MNLDEQRHRYRVLNDWFKTAQGHALGQAAVARVLQAKLQGEMSLQLGLCGDYTWLSDAKFKQCYVSTPCLDLSAQVSKHALIASPDNLPFHRNSMDCVIAPMMLEVFGRDHMPLDELDRILSPMGHVVFVGIKPLSLWGLAAYAHRLPCFGEARMNLYSPLALKRDLQRRGYQQTRFETFYYVPPFQRHFLIKKSFFLNEMGKMVSLFPAGFYCLVMQKHQPCSSQNTERTRRDPILLAG